jgi:hypothetical protein
MKTSGQVDPKQTAKNGAGQDSLAPFFAVPDLKKRRKNVII